MRGPHGVVKSIRPGLEPRLPSATYGGAARTASTEKKTWKMSWRKGVEEGG